ncbi:unnamed protein product [Sphagnum jensenii]|uniref:Ribosomal protein L22 n=1 Tax=Sphagnum jensenii TaxID=128206 RepID=A0ABP0X469_9BRYO
MARQYQEYEYVSETQVERITSENRILITKFEYRKSKSVSKKVIEGSRLTEALSRIACSAVLGGKAGLEIEKGSSGTYRCEASVVYHNALV